MILMPVVTYEHQGRDAAELVQCPGGEKYDRGLEGCGLFNVHQGKCGVKKGRKNVCPTISILVA